jgi:hypothetical protein
MLTRQEREELVIDLYNQGRTIRDIAKEVRMSFRDIGVVLKKEEKEKERQKRQLDNNMSNTKNNCNLGRLSLSTQAYELFSQGKTPRQVAIELDLKGSQVTKYYKEYWKLDGLYKLNQVHEEIKDDIIYFLKLYRSSKDAEMSTDYVMKLLEIANNNLPALEDKYKKLQQNVNHLESRELDLSITLEELRSQIQNAKQRLHFYVQCSQKEVSKILNLNRKNLRLKALVKQFKNNSEEYVKIRSCVKQAVKSALSDDRHLLKLALVSLVESLRANPSIFNSLIYSVPSKVAISKSIITDSAWSSSNDYHTNHPLSYYNQNSYAETIIEIIVNGANSLYEKAVEDFTNQIMNHAAECTSAGLLPSMKYSDERMGHRQASLVYRHVTQTSVYDR